MIFDISEKVAWGVGGAVLGSLDWTGGIICKDIASVNLLLSNIDLLLGDEDLPPSHKLEKKSLKLLPLATK